ncbi:MAG: tRNA (adenosine(37)-N6)-threonylcarbamoyltransferase complex ATPase subunit type 1 TsaE [Actinomycetaceae bacterium]|nr:tRNA (adenosine(37)-N6)-threonylcarbamoyltransferase complex ATPase subunit type 1 TsaE [Actinomycetaceae bacterium]
MAERLWADNAEDMRHIGAALASVLQAGDLIVLDGPLGAGKTTLTQGIGEGLGVRGRVTSPTFIISRIHPNNAGLPLVHVDAYRLGDVEEVDDLDLEALLADGVMVVEWGEGKVEALSPNRLHLTISRALQAGGTQIHNADEGRRIVELHTTGERWEAVDMAQVFAPYLQNIDEAGA